MHQLLPQILETLAGQESCIALTGGGGKTTCLIQLASLYAKMGKRVLISTTTKLLLPDVVDYGCDSYFFDDAIFKHSCQKGERVFYALRGKKALAPPEEHLKQLLNSYDVMLLEADGSRHLGLKLHNDKDPVVPSFVTATIALASFATLNKEFPENCFGYELYSEEFPEQVIDLLTFKKLLLHAQGITKGITGRGLVLFNQTTLADKEACRELASGLFIPYPLFFGSLQQNILIYRKDV
jgi:probable selenium-dependent hydroxylase accessory protein YqeC